MLRTRYRDRGLSSLGGGSTAPIVTDDGDGTATITLVQMDAPIVVDDGDGTATVTPVGGYA